MSVPRTIRVAFVALCSIGLGVPASAFGGCCCGDSVEKTAEQSAQVNPKSCCGGAAEKLSHGCQLETECSVRQTCQFCKVQPVAVPDKPLRHSTPPADQTFAWAGSAPISVQMAFQPVAAGPPFNSHNARLSLISVWRK